MSYSTHEYSTHEYSITNHHNAIQHMNILNMQMNIQWILKTCNSTHEYSITNMNIWARCVTYLRNSCHALNPDYLSHLVSWVYASFQQSMIPWTAMASPFWKIQNAKSNQKRNKLNADKMRNEGVKKDDKYLKYANLRNSPEV